MLAALVAALALAGCGEAGDQLSRSETRPSITEPGAKALAKAGTEARAKARAKRIEQKGARAKSRVKSGSRKRAKKVRLEAKAPVGDLDCGDFSNQAQAQRRLAGGDPHGLDGDGDKLACTSLPCPCSKATPGKGSASPAGIGGATAFRARVESVTDGDTLDLVTLSGKEETIRLIGIDTPEVYGGVECGGRAASNEMKRLAVGAVTVRTDPTQDRRDRYGRLLAYVNRGDLDLGRTMIARGLASAYVYDEVFQRYPGYRQSQKKARAKNRGSWPACDMSPG